MHEEKAGLNTDKFAIFWVHFSEKFLSLIVCT